MVIIGSVACVFLMVCVMEYLSKSVVEAMCQPKPISVKANRNYKC